MVEHTETTVSTFEELSGLVRSRCTGAELELIKRAYTVAEKAHVSQKRSTGEPYITHPVAVAGILANLKLDPPTIAAALMHDVAEDTPITLDEIEKDFGKEIRHLIDAVTKLSKREGIKKEFTSGDGKAAPSVARTPEEKTTYRTDREAESFRKMMLGLADDTRVVLIKLADRLHNMRTLDAVPPEKQRRIARETLDIFAPLANRLGIWEWKQELEDLGFRYAEPATYQYLSRMLEMGAAERNQRVQHYIASLRSELAANGIEDVEITGRAKQIYSIWRKMQRKNSSFDMIRDAQAIRVVINDEAYAPADHDDENGHSHSDDDNMPVEDVLNQLNAERERELRRVKVQQEHEKLRNNPSIQQCYQALGTVHRIWKAIPGEYDDYISVPKDNQYRSLHTAVITDDGGVLEVQIRTHSMHKAAEFGVAAHWLYKESSDLSKDYMDRIEELRNAIRAIGSENEDARSFVAALKDEHFKDSIYCFTPMGKLLELPNGVTVLDFAYHVHTEIGHKCRGARVNGVIQPLTYKLKTGDQVEVLTRPHASPSRDWLHDAAYLSTPSARSKVKAWFRKQQREHNVQGGRDMIEREMRRLSVEDWMKMDDVYRIFEVADDKREEFLEQVGYGIITIGSVSGKIIEEERKRERERQGLLGSIVPLLRPSRADKAASKPGKGGFTVAGVHGLLVTPASCCNPLPGDDVVGYVTVGQGVKVHRRDCKNVPALERERMIDIAYEGEGVEAYPVQFLIRSAERPGMLYEITSVLAENKINILGCNIDDRDLNKGEVQIWLKVELTSVGQVSQVMSKLEKVQNVFEVRRLASGNKR